MCEIALGTPSRQSGFPHEFKRASIGEHYFLSSSRSNDGSKTHLSGIRVAYRFETYHAELNLLEHLAGLKYPRAMYTVQQEQDILGTSKNGESPAGRRAKVSSRRVTMR